jgi:hypothetical protein
MEKRPRCVRQAAHLYNWDNLTMKRRPIHRGGILSAGYDSERRCLDVEFDTHRLVRVENIGPEAASRFLDSGSPASYWRDEIEENYVIREISAKEEEAEKPRSKQSLEALKKLFGDA